MNDEYRKARFFQMDKKEVEEKLEKKGKMKGYIISARAKSNLTKKELGVMLKNWDIKKPPKELEFWRGAEITLKDVEKKMGFPKGSLRIIGDKLIREDK